jgi:glycine hydroxymethyltransferase
MLIDLRSKGLTGKVAEEALGQAGITVNKNMVPFDDQSPMVTSGIRIGTAAVTTRGFSAKEILQVVEWIDEALTTLGEAALLSDIHSRVNAFMENYPLYPGVQASV